ncbi:uncharacterized protein [Branchiostoma lanceolatum]|uniref:uncharacterized protein n=1 Tax=Branchiostoma lanceolatum TaxID=7740 RepID=UPI0034552A96
MFMFMSSSTTGTMAEDNTTDIASRITTGDSLSDGMTQVSSDPVPGNPARRLACCDGDPCIQPCAVRYLEDDGDGGNCNMSTEIDAAASNGQTVVDVALGTADIVEPPAFSYMCQDHVVFIETSSKEAHPQNAIGKPTVHIEPPFESADDDGNHFTKLFDVQYRAGDVKIPTKSGAASEDEQTDGDFHDVDTELCATVNKSMDDITSIETTSEETQSKKSCQEAETATSTNDDVSAPMVRCDSQNDADTACFSRNESGTHDILHPLNKLQPNSTCTGNSRDPNPMYPTSTIIPNPTDKAQHNLNYNSPYPPNIEKPSPAYGQTVHPELLTLESEGIFRIQPYAVRYDEEDDGSNSDISTRGAVAGNGQTIDIVLGDDEDANIEPIQPYAVAFMSHDDMSSIKTSSEETQSKESSQKTTSANSSNIPTSLYQNDASVSGGKDTCHIDGLRRSPNTLHPNPKQNALIPNPMYAANVGQQAACGSRCRRVCLAVATAIALLVSLIIGVTFLAMFLSTQGSRLVASTVNTTHAPGHPAANTTYSFNHSAFFGPRRTTTVESIPMSTASSTSGSSDNGSFGEAVPTVMPLSKRRRLIGTYLMRPGVMFNPSSHGSLFDYLRRVLNRTENATIRRWTSDPGNVIDN